MNSNLPISHKDSPKVSIVILNWNNWIDTLKCLKSIFQINYSSYNVVLVDNASTDHSISEIRNFSTSISSGIVELNENELNELKINSENSSFHHSTGNDIKSNVKSDFKSDMQNSFSDESIFGKKMFLIKNNENHGFAGGNNIGMNFALEHLNPDYILLLNNDTIVSKHFLDEMLNVARSNDSVGSVQAALLNHSGTAIDSLGQECYWWGAEDICMGTSLDKGRVLLDEDQDNMEIFGSCAAAALYPSEVLRKTGLFDDVFFVELEDVDLSWRIRLMGYKSYLGRKSLVYHKRGVSGTITSIDLIRGMTNKAMISKWHHQSKNWLIIVLRYYSLSRIIKALFRYPHKVFFTFFRLIYSCIWLRKIRETLKILFDNSKTGKDIKKNPYWHETEVKWVKKGPSKCNGQKNN